jgi:hypothetical protein
LAGCDCGLALGGLADPEQAASVRRGTVAAAASHPWWRFMDASDVRNAVP